MSRPTRQRWNSGIVAVASGIIANILLGASSIYWRELGEIHPITLVFYRILLSLPTLIFVIWVTDGLNFLQKRPAWFVLFLHAVAAILVVINWVVFIWASIYGHVLESGLGYLLAPCVTIFIGVFVFQEKISRVGMISMTLILMALALLLIRSGELNKIVYLTIAITWGGYVCLKKITPLRSLHGLVYETSFLFALCLLAVMISSWSIRLPYSYKYFDFFILGMAGVISIIPLFLFGYAANRLPLSAMGLFQFILPTTQLIIAVLVYRQSVSSNSLMAFGIIWAALVLYVIYPLVSLSNFFEKRGCDESQL